MDQFDAIMFAEQADHLFGLAQPHQAVVDEHAGQLVADRFVDQHRRHRAVDAAGQAADDAAFADLCADVGDLGRAKFRHRPVARQAADMAHEIGEQLAAIGGVDDFGMELGGVEALGLVRGHGEGRAFAGRDDLETGGELRHLVAMAHPHLMALALVPQAVEQRAALLDLDEGAAEFAALAAFDIAAQLLHHRLLAIADAQYRHARVEDRLRCAGTVFPHDRRWPARQDHALGLHPGKGFRRAVERGDFGIDAGFAHAPGDELGHLAAEVHDKDGILKGQRHRIAFVSPRDRDSRPVTVLSRPCPAQVRARRARRSIPATRRWPERRRRSGRRCR